MAYDGPGRLSIAVNKAFGSKSRLFNPLRFCLRLILHLEIPQRFFESGLRLVHPYNIIIHPGSKIGCNITIFHNVTIGAKNTGRNAGCPTLEDNVTVFPHSIILGNVTIGHDSLVGAGSVVVNSVPAHCSVAGNPARVVGESGNVLSKWGRA